MIKFILIFVFGFLFETLIAAKVDDANGILSLSNILHGQTTTYDLRQILASYRNQCLNSDLEYVEECYDGHVEVFKNFPGQVHGFGETVLSTFRRHIDVLTIWTHGNSTTISEGATSIIHGLSFLYKLGKDANTFLIENGKATPKLFSTYRKIEINLKKEIGKLYRAINGGLTCLQKLFAEILKQFLNRHRRSCDRDPINFKGIMTCGRLLASRVAFIIETALGDCGGVTIANDTYDALAVTACVLYDSLMAILAVLTAMASIILKETGAIPAYLNSCLSVLNTFILGIHETMISLTTGTPKDVRDLLQTVAAQVSTLNEDSVQLLGPLEDIDISAVDVQNNLKSSDSRKNTAEFESWY